MCINRTKRSAELPVCSLFENDVKMDGIQTKKRVQSERRRIKICVSFFLHIKIEIISQKGGTKKMVNTNLKFKSWHEMYDFLSSGKDLYNPSLTM